MIDCTIQMAPYYEMCISLLHSAHQCACACVEQQAKSTRICRSDTTGATSGTGTYYTLRAPEFADGSCSLNLQFSVQCFLYHCLSFVLFWVIVLSVFPRFIAFDYSIGIYNMFLLGMVLGVRFIDFVWLFHVARYICLNLA